MTTRTLTGGIPDVYQALDPVGVILYPTRTIDPADMYAIDPNGIAVALKTPDQALAGTLYQRAIYRVEIRCSGGVTVGVFRLVPDGTDGAPITLTELLASGA